MRVLKVSLLCSMVFSVAPVVHSQDLSQWEIKTSVDDFTDEKSQGLSLNSDSYSWENLPANLYIGCNNKTGKLDSLLSIPVRSKTKYLRRSWFVDAQIRIDDEPVQKKLLITDISGQTLLFWGGQYLDPVLSGSKLRIRLPRAGGSGYNTMSFKIPNDPQVVEAQRSYCAAQKK